MRLKATLLALTVMTLAATPDAGAQLTAASALRSAPLEIIAPVSGNTLEQLIVFAESGMTSHREQNLMQGDAGITLLEPDHGRMVTGEGRTLDLYLLPAAKGDTVIALIETLQTSAAPDSRLTMWSRSWQPLPRLWTEPKADQWLTDRGKRRRDDFERAVSFMLTDYSFSPAEGVLTLVNRTDSVLSAEQRKAADGLMLPTLHYVWTPKGFKPAKKK